MNGDWRLHLLFTCPRCEAKPGESCVAPSGRKTRAHAERLALPCAATYIGQHSYLNGHDMRCARKAGHNSRHRTRDGRLEWSRDHDPDAFLRLLEEAL